MLTDDGLLTHILANERGGEGHALTPTASDMRVSTSMIRLPSCELAIALLFNCCKASVRTGSRILFDLLFAVSQLARFCASDSTAQRAALHHLMLYLVGNPSFKITHRRGMRHADLQSSYADADRGKSSSSRSTSGIVRLYNKVPIMWKSKMQRLRRSLRWRPSTAPHWRSCEVLYLLALLPASDSGRRSLPLYMRTNSVHRVG